jgi:TRAP-type C4-dicarboxylate transport system substrate-binding protein
MKSSMNRRRFLKTGAAGLVLAPSIARPAARAEFNLAFATLAPRGSSFHQSFQSMGQRWRESTNGRVGVTIYPGTQGGESAIVRRMGINQLQGAMLTAGGMGLIDKSPTALQLLPMMFQSWAEVDHVRETMRPRLEEAFNRRGYAVLFWGDAGWVRWFTKERIERPADLKGKKIFASAGDTESMEIMKDYYDPVALEPDKIFTALTTGLIEGVTLPPFLANFTQVATVAKHMLDLKYTPVTGALLVTRRTWEKLPADLRETMRVVAEETGAEVRKNSREEDDAAIDAMKNNQGLQITVATPEIEREWRTAIAHAYPQIRGTLVPAPLFDEVEKLLKEFRARTGG